MVDITKQVVAVRLDNIGVSGQNTDALTNGETLDKILTMEYDRLLYQNRLSTTAMSFFGRPKDEQVVSAPSATCSNTGPR